MSDDRLQTLRQFVLGAQARDPELADIAGPLDDLDRATRRLSRLVRRGALAGVLGTAGSENVQGETQKKLDVISNDTMLEALEWTGHWAALGSEEMDDCYPIPAQYQRGRYLCLFDPLDGSSNIDVNINVGTIFSVLRCPEGVTEPENQDFLQPGTEQVAAGIAVYGPSTVFVLTVGNGTHGFTLDPNSGDYLLTHPGMTIPPDTGEYCINAANRRFWSDPVRRYIDECMEGEAGPRGKAFNMRYVGSMVGDVYRILCRGGIFLYPWDSRDPGKPGKLRLMYEANPMGFLVEQAGGACSTGSERVLEIRPAGLHQRCAVVLGSKNEVERVVGYHGKA